jgi:hypothetical protein
MEFARILVGGEISGYVIALAAVGQVFLSAVKELRNRSVEESRRPNFEERDKTVANGSREDSSSPSGP